MQRKMSGILKNLTPFGSRTDGQPEMNEDEEREAGAKKTTTKGQDDSVGSLIVEDTEDLDMDLNLIIYERSEEMRKREERLEKFNALTEELKHQRNARRREQAKYREDYQKMTELYFLLGGQGEFIGGIEALERQINLRLNDFNKIRSDLEERFNTVDVRKVFEKQARMTLKIKSLKEELDLARNQQQSTVDERLKTMEDTSNRLRDEISELSFRYDEFQNNQDWQDIENIKRVCANLGRQENDPRLLSQFLETKIAEIKDELFELVKMKKQMEEFCGQKFQSASDMEVKLCRVERAKEFTALIPVEEDDEVPARQLSKSKKFRQKLSPQNELSQIRRMMEEFLLERCRLSDRVFFDKETPFFRQFESKLKTINPTEDWALELINQLKSERDDLLCLLTELNGGVNLNSQFKTPQEIAEKLNDMKTNAIVQCFDVFEDELEAKTDADATEFIFHLISEYYDFTIERKHKLFEDLRDNYCKSRIKIRFLVGGLSRVIRDCYEPKDEQFLNERGGRFGELLEHMRYGGKLSEIVRECGVLSFLVVWSENPRLELYPIGDEQEQKCHKDYFNREKYEELFATRKRTQDDLVERVVFPGLFEEGDEGKRNPSSTICVLIKE